MRRVHYADVACAARALMCVPAQERRALCSAMVSRARRAEAHRQLHGVAHPRWGTGSLMEVARAWPMRPEPGFDDPDYCAALRVVLANLQAEATSRRRS